MALVREPKQTLRFGPDAAMAHRAVLHALKPAPDSLAIIGAWAAWLEASYAPATVETYLQAVDHLARHARKPLVELDEADVASFIARYPARAAVRATYLHGIRSLFRFCVRHGYVSSDPTADIRTPAPRTPQPRALSAEELRRVIEAAGEVSPLRAAGITLLYLTGMRRAEAAALSWSDVGGDGIRIRSGKGGRERVIPMTERLEAVLEEMRAYTGRTSYVYGGRTAGTIYAWVREASERSGIACHPHVLRATFATRMLERGARIHTVSQLLGHRSIQTTMRYLAVTEPDRLAAVRSL